MTTIERTNPDRFVELLARLGEKSTEDYYNPYRTFSWAPSLPEDEYWMTPALVSAYGTEVADELGEDGMKRLSQWESINFYSLNVHGIRELLIEVVKRVHMPGFELPSEFFHHFIGEENEHMWFFAEFCRRYGKKLYSSPSLPTRAESDPEIENFLVFARILLFEEIVDHYNLHLADDTNLHETIRQVNRCTTTTSPVTSHSAANWSRCSTHGSVTGLGQSACASSRSTSSATSFSACSRSTTLMPIAMPASLTRWAPEAGSWPRRLARPPSARRSASRCPSWSRQASSRTPSCPHSEAVGQLHPRP